MRIFTKILAWTYILTRKVFKSKTNNDVVESVVSETVDIHSLDLSHIPQPTILNNNGTKTLLIVNDIPSMLKLLEIDLEDINNENNKLIDTYKIILCSGKYANLMAYKYIKENKINKALVDVILSDSLLIVNDHMVEFTGFDLIREIKKYNSETEIAVFTAMNLKHSNNSGNRYDDIFSKLWDNNIIDRYINVNLSNTKSNLKNLLTS